MTLQAYHEFIRKNKSKGFSFTESRNLWHEYKALQEFGKNTKRKRSFSDGEEEEDDIHIKFRKQFYSDEDSAEEIQFLKQHQNEEEGEDDDNYDEEINRNKNISSFVKQLSDKKLFKHLSRGFLLELQALLQDDQEYRNFIELIMLNFLKSSSCNYIQ